MSTLIHFILVLIHDILVGVFLGHALGYACLRVVSAMERRDKRRARERERQAELKERVVVYMVPVVAEPGQEECDFSRLFSADDARHGNVRGFYLGPDGEVVELDHLERRQI